MRLHYTEYTIPRPLLEKLLAYIAVRARILPGYVRDVEHALLDTLIQEERRKQAENEPIDVRTCLKQKGAHE
jgi:hypothetical protein